MGETDSIRCANCDEVVDNQSQVEDLFGTRNSGYVLLVKSWCQKCR